MQVSIIMGSSSDYSLVREGEVILNDFGIEFEVKVLSAHRTPNELVEYVSSLKEKGIKLIIAVAGKAAALPGVVAAHTTIPVVGVPVQTSLLGIDSLLSICQMPSGVPVATMGIGKSGMINACLFAIHCLSVYDKVLEEKLLTYRRKMAEKVLNWKKE